MVYSTDTFISAIALVKHPMQVLVWCIARTPFISATALVKHPMQVLVWCIAQTLLYRVHPVNTAHTGMGAVSPGELSSYRCWYDSSSTLGTQLIQVLVWEQFHFENTAHTGVGMGVVPL